MDWFENKLTYTNIFMGNRRIRRIWFQMFHCMVLIRHKCPKWFPKKMWMIFKILIQEWTEVTFSLIDSKVSSLNPELRGALLCYYRFKHSFDPSIVRHQKPDRQREKTISPFEYSWVSRSSLSGFIPSRNGRWFSFFDPSIRDEKNICFINYLNRAKFHRFSVKFHGNDVINGN